MFLTGNSNSLGLNRANSDPLGVGCVQLLRMLLSRGFCTEQAATAANNAGLGSLHLADDLNQITSEKAAI